MVGDCKTFPLEEGLSALIDYRGKSPPKSSDGTPVISAKVVKGGRILHPVEQTIDPNYYTTWMRRGIPSSGDVVLTTEGPLGEVAQLDNITSKYAIAQRVVVLRGKPEVLDNTFLKYLLMSQEQQQILASFATGTTVEGISQKMLRSMPITIPGINQQRAIAQILGMLDDKVELNGRMNETLEAMARALFKSWFVDFDPVRAKVEGRDFGMPTEIADLFPDSLEDTELGEVPMGWEVAPLPKAIEVNPTRPLRKGSIAPYLDMSNMPTRGHTPDEVINRPFGSGMRFMNGDTLVARITPCLENGKTAYVDFLEDGEVGWGSTEYIVLRPRPPLPEEFAYCLARSDGFREFAIQSMTGSSGRQRVPAESLSHYILVIPPRQIAECFGSLVRPLFKRVSAAATESRTLAALRDTLLPKLISGEVTLSRG